MDLEKYGFMPINKTFGWENWKKKKDEKKCRSKMSIWPYTQCPMLHTTSTCSMGCYLKWIFVLSNPYRIGNVMGWVKTK